MSERDIYRIYFEALLSALAKVEATADTEFYLWKAALLCAELEGVLVDGEPLSLSVFDFLYQVLN